jgi:hypothetical protein
MSCRWTIGSEKKMIGELFVLPVDDQPFAQKCMKSTFQVVWQQHRTEQSHEIFSLAVRQMLQSEVGSNILTRIFKLYQNFDKTIH